MARLVDEGFALLGEHVFHLASVVRSKGHVVPCTGRPLGCSGMEEGDISGGEALQGDLGSLLDVQSLAEVVKCGRGVDHNVCNSRRLGEIGGDIGHRVLEGPDGLRNADLEGVQFGALRIKRWPWNLGPATTRSSSSGRLRLNQERLDLILEPLVLLLGHSQLIVHFAGVGAAFDIGNLSIAQALLELRASLLQRIVHGLLTGDAGEEVALALPQLLELGGEVLELLISALLSLGVDGPLRFGKPPLQLLELLILAAQLLLPLGHNPLELPTLVLQVLHLLQPWDHLTDEVRIKARRVRH
mmetsp:Transcript_31392/g.91305  ORF Transcript_31392/g.91305 Transcript_31392/m.91305 type:complete len:300 (-) Transcript_31392:285-1184(-)